MVDSLEWSAEALELHLLRWLARSDDNRISAIPPRFMEYVKYRHPEYYNKLFVRQVAEAASSLLRQGLIYVDFVGVTQASGWDLRLTQTGRIAVEDGAYSPYDSEEYLKRFQADVPAVSPTILRYAREALLSYRAGCYLATAVMAGVASEVGFGELCESLSLWLSKETGQAGEDEFRKKLASKRSYSGKFGLFRTTIEMNREKIGKAILDNIEIALNSILDIFRIYRNDAGHAIGQPVRKQDADLILHLFPTYIQRLYQLKDGLGS